MIRKQLEKHSVGLEVFPFARGLSLGFRIVVFNRFSSEYKKDPLNKFDLGNSIKESLLKPVM